MNIRVKVQVRPQSRRERFEKRGEHEFSAAIKERPERNEANDRVQQLVARHYNVPLTSVRFLTGMHSTKKTFDVVQ